KAELIDAEVYAAWAAGLAGDAGQREREFAGVLATHDRILAELGVFDEGGVLARSVGALRSDAALRERGARGRGPARGRGGAARPGGGDGERGGARAPGAGAASLLRFTEQRYGA